jgi:hypothetical protein
MRLYVDDDSVDPGLIRLLRRDGHVEPLVIAQKTVSH